MKIAREETMVFGDNFNDIGMLNAAGESYAVASAHPEVQKKQGISPHPVRRGSAEGTEGAANVHISKAGGTAECIRENI